LIKDRLCGKSSIRAARIGAQSRKGDSMDYKAQGTPKKGGKIPRHNEHNAPGTDKNPFGKRPSKEELIARLKAKTEKTAK
jgi:hypothetical protein